MPTEPQMTYIRTQVSHLYPVTYTVTSASVLLEWRYSLIQTSSGCTVTHTATPWM